MKFKIIINYKSVRECYMAINPMIRKIFIWFYRYVLSNVNCFLLFSSNSFFSSIFLVYICDYY